MRKTTLLTVILFLGIPFFLTAQTNWTGATDTDWLKASNWDNGVPTAGNDAMIPAVVASGNFPLLTASIAQNFQIINDGILSLGASGGITSTDMFVNNGTLDLTVNNSVFTNSTGGDLNNSGTILITGTFTNDGGTLDNVLGGSITCDFNFFNNGTGVVNNAGLFTSNATFGNMADFNNIGTINFNSFAGNNGFFNNSGMMTVAAAVLFDNQLSFTNQNGGMVDIGGAFNNQITLKMESGSDFNLLAGSTLNNFFNILIESGGTLTNNGDYMNNPCGTLINEGSLVNNNAMNNSGIISTSTVPVAPNAQNDNGNGITFDPANSNGVVCFNETHDLDAAGSAIFILKADLIQFQIDDCNDQFSYGTNDNLSFGCSEFGINQVTFTIDAPFNRSFSCVSDITINDPHPAVPTCNVIPIFLDAAGNGTLTPIEVFGAGADNCNIINPVSVSPNTFDCNDANTSPTVTLTVNDGHANISTCTTTVNISDLILPNMVCQNITVQLGAGGAATITAADVDGGSSDACGISSLSVFPDVFDCTSIGGISVTLSAIDVNGNPADCNATVTVEDNIPPMAVCQNITVQLDASGSGSLIASDIDGGSSDNCGAPSLSANPTNFDCSQVGTVTSTLTVSDISGNSSNCPATITVEDNVLPNAVCQPVFIQLNAAGVGMITTADIDGGSSDNCGIANLSINTTTFNCSDVSDQNLVTLTVTDVNGNIATCSEQVFVMDMIAPDAVCQDITVQLDATEMPLLYRQMWTAVRRMLAEF